MKKLKEGYAYNYSAIVLKSAHTKVSHALALLAKDCRY
jgi:hypothetical protein